MFADGQAKSEDNQREDQAEDQKSNPRTVPSEKEDIADGDSSNTGVHSITHVKVRVMLSSIRINLSFVPSAGSLGVVSCIGSPIWRQFSFYRNVGCMVLCVVVKDPLERNEGRTCIIS